MLKINNKYGYIGKPKQCKCGGIFVYYDGLLGYESLVCNKCKLDINDDMLKESTCNCGRRFIESSVNSRCFRCDEEDKRRNKLIEEYNKQKLCLHLIHMLDFK